MEAYSDTLEVDVSTRVATTIGQGVHSILERARRPGIDTIEQRYFAGVVVDGTNYVLSAQIDLYESDTKALYDWKTTKSYAFHKRGGSKFEWEAQMNIGRYLMERSGLEVKSLNIIGLLKDWNLKTSRMEPGYPPTEVMTTEIDIWPLIEIEAYIDERIRAIVKARHTLPLCGTKDHWGGRRCEQWCDANSVCEQYKQSRKTGVINEVSEVRNGP